MLGIIRLITFGLFLYHGLILIAIITLGKFLAKTNILWFRFFTDPFKTIESAAEIARIVSRQAAWTLGSAVFLIILHLYT